MTVRNFSMSTPYPTMDGNLITSVFDNITVCRFPSIEEAEKLLETHDYIINVFEDKFNGDASRYGYNTEYARSTNLIKKGVNCLYHPIMHNSIRSVDSLKFVVDFFAKNKDKKIAIHCRSGLHRSIMCIEAHRYITDGGSISDCNMLPMNMIDGYNLFPVTLSQMDEMLADVKNNLISVLD